MSDPTQPAPADAAAPSVQPPAAPVVAPAAPPPAAPPVRVLNPYAVPPQRPPAPAAAQPAPIAPAVEAAPAADPAIAAMQADLARLRGIVGEDVTRDLAAAPDGVRASVLALAGDDPLEQRRVLATLRAHGVAGPVTLPPGASTAVPTQQPTPAAPASPDATALAEWELAKSKGATLVAAALRARHSAAIDRALAARGARN